MNNYSTAKNDNKLPYFGYTPWYFSKDSLKEIVIEDGVTYIGENAFRTISSFTKITIPNTVTSIGDYAFRGCTGITDVYFGGTEEEWNKIDFGASNTSLTNATVHFAQKGIDYLANNLSVIRGNASIVERNGEECIIIEVAEGKAATGFYRQMKDGATVELVDIKGNVQVSDDKYVAYKSQNDKDPVATLKVTHAGGVTETFSVVFDVCSFDTSYLKPIRGTVSTKTYDGEEWIAVTVAEGKNVTGIYNTMSDGGTVEMTDFSGTIQVLDDRFVAYQSQNKTNPVATMKITYADGSIETHPVVFELYEIERKFLLTLQKSSDLSEVRFQRKPTRKAIILKLKCLRVSRQSAFTKRLKTAV